MVPYRPRTTTKKEETKKNHSAIPFNARFVFSDTFFFFFSEILVDSERSEERGVFCLPTFLNAFCIFTRYVGGADEFLTFPVMSLTISVETGKFTAITVY